MASEAAKLLDELMGRYRNFAPDEKPGQLTWDSPEMCHYFVGKLCPHDLFNNTKADLGPCKGIHDDDVKLEFAKLPGYKRAPYEDEYIRFAQSLINEVERKIRKSRERLELRPDDRKLSSLVPPQYSRHEEKISMLTEKINSLVEDAESLGCRGQVEEAQGIMKLCDNLRNERDSLRRQNEGSVWHQAAEIAASQEKQMDVCEICGSFLIIGDAQQRIDDHLSGKIHRGYARLRESIEEIRSHRDKEREEMEAKREERRRQWDEEKGARSGGARGGDDNELRDRGTRDRDRDRDTRDRDRSTRDRDRETRDRDRDRITRDRDRERDRGTRDRDRDGDRRRSRDRDRGKSRDQNRSRGRSRDHDRDRGKSRDHDRDLGKSRDHDRDRGKSRDRDRRKSGEKDRERSRDRDRARDRSRDRDRNRARSSDKYRDGKKSRDKGDDRRKSRDKDRERVKSRDRDRDIRRSRDSSRDRHRDKKSRDKDDMNNGCDRKDSDRTSRKRSRDDSHSPRGSGEKRKAGSSPTEGGKQLHADAEQSCPKEGGNDPVNETRREDLERVARGRSSPEEGVPQRQEQSPVEDCSRPPAEVADNNLSTDPTPHE